MIGIDEALLGKMARNGKRQTFIFAGIDIEIGLSKAKYALNSSGTRLFAVSVCCEEVCVLCLGDVDSPLNYWN